jgi:hypothetical protein
MLMLESLRPAGRLLVSAGVRRDDRAIEIVTALLSSNDCTAELGRQ